MIIIAHRGNTNGHNKARENHPSYIDEAINDGFDVEVDVWVIDDKIMLGHDGPAHHVDIEFLEKIADKAWFHCKNLKALRSLSETNFRYFWHQSDDFTLTSTNHIWTYPNKDLTDRSIAVMPKNYESVASLDIYGICTDDCLQLQAFMKKNRL